MPRNKKEGGGGKEGLRKGKKTKSKGRMEEDRLPSSGDITLSNLR